MGVYIQKLKEILSLHFKFTRKRYRLTQNSMSEILHIAPRSYIELEHGKSLCCTCVFFFYLQFLGKEKALLLVSEILDAFMGLDKEDNEIA